MKHGNQFGLILAVVILLCVMYFSSVITGYVPFLILLIAATFISFISLFLIHYRMLQIRFTIFNAVILVAFQCWLAYAFFTRPAGTRFPITAVFPIICAILSFLAVHDIATDEATVRTVDAIKKMKKNKKK
ncbi:MAG: DUF4293 family protein [Bacteroidales bacterium]|jgi:hypothetical protein|nr:DUF4293 family protein [Bacteroidales bacterium]MCI1734089.1 DUF4293 family protein [Bacteroidales bacterium]